MNFNEKLINLRKSKGLSQEELGNELKVSRQTISKWESCQSYPDFQRLVLLSDFFRRFFKVCVWYVVPDHKRCDETTERT